MKKAHKKSEKGPTKIPKKVKDKVKPLVQKLLSKCTDIKPVTNKIDWDEVKEFYDVLQNVIELEKVFTLTLPNRNDNWKKFYEWCSKHNAKFDSVTFKEINEGNYGAVALKDIEESEAFLRVPRKIIMSELTSKASKLGPLITSDTVLQHMPNVQIAMHLIMEFLSSDSQWMPYISILPSSFNTILYFTFDELKELQGSPVLEEVIKLVYSVVRQYCYFSQVFQTNSYAKSLEIGNYFTFELYRWAVSVVMTRQNFIPSPDGAANITSLVPLFDMCNHANGRLATDFSLEDDMLISYSCKPFAKGSEVFTFYGNRTNGEFFVHNAFVYPENENDAVEIKLGLGKNDPLLNLKKDLCNKIKISVNGPFYIHKGGVIGQELFAFLQINVMKADELENHLNEDKDEEILHTSGNNPDLKKRAFSFLKDRLFLLLKCYKTTLEDDEDLLKCGPPENQNLHLTIQLRTCEKKILNEAYKFCVENAT